MTTSSARRHIVTLLAAVIALLVATPVAPAEPPVKDPETYCGPSGYIYVGGGQYVYMAYSHRSAGGQYIYRHYNVYFRYANMLKTYRTANRCG